MAASSAVRPLEEEIVMRVVRSILVFAALGVLACNAVVVQRAQDLLIVAAPPGPPGDAPVVVTNRDGNYAIAAMGYRYLP